MKASEMRRLQSPTLSVGQLAGESRNLINVIERQAIECGCDSLRHYWGRRIRRQPEAPRANLHNAALFRSIPFSSVML
jgi:hypothetical protein